MAKFADHILEGDHASRPGAGTVPDGTIYACSDHNLVYQSLSGSWGTWASLGSPADILDLATAETDDTLVLAPDGAGGVEFRTEVGGAGGMLVSGTGREPWGSQGSLFDGFDATDTDPIAGWTTLGSPDTVSTNTAEDSILKVAETGAGSNNV